MKNIALRFVYDRGNRATRTKKAPLLVEVRQLGTNKTTYVNTGIRLFPNQFSKRNGLTIKNHDKAGQITIKAKNVFNRVEEFAFSDQCTCIDDVKHYKQSETFNKNVVDWMRKELRESNPTSSVLEHHNVLINQVENFGKIRLFSDVTYKNIDAFDKFLRNTINSQPVLYKRHNAFKRYIRRAVKLGLCKSNPYDDFKYSKGEPLKKPVFLTDKELQKIIEFDIKDDKLERVRDLFIFQCFTGLAYVDLSNFDKSWITEEAGYKIIRGLRSKTNVEFMTLLLPKAEKILRKYEYELPIISNQKYNDYLKLIKAGTGIRKNITTHAARHTFATYLLNKDIPIETVSRAVGHSSIKQTEHYAKLLGRKVIRDMKVLLE